MKIRERRCDACRAVINGNWFSLRTRGWERGRSEHLDGEPEWPRRVHVCDVCWFALPAFIKEREGGKS
jgi:hypothetical protein